MTERKCGVCGHVLAENEEHDILTCVVLLKRDVDMLNKEKLRLQVKLAKVSGSYLSLKDMVLSEFKNSDKHFCNIDHILGLGDGNDKE